VVGSTCETTGCVLQCHTGRGDCDSDISNGCEADLGDVASCGRCGNDCTQLPNVNSAACIEGACSGLTCKPGFADCNGDPQDGCERSLSTLSDCGGCDKPCSVAHAQAECVDQQCRTGTCDEGFGDCDANTGNGCETLLNEPTHCGTCTSVCSSGMSCSNGTCSCETDAQCQSGQHCCDGQCVSTGGSCFPFPCIPTTQLPANALNCGACGSVCLGWCCGPLL
jgi:hypothetical protein